MNPTLDVSIAVVCGGPSTEAEVSRSSGKYISILMAALLSSCSSYSILQPTSELHSIGVYEGTDPQDDGRPWHSKCGDANRLSCHQKMTQRKREIGGQVIVNVSITGKPLVLAFTAYDKTKWVVKAQEGVLIEKIILGGYHSQSVEGIPLETPVEVYTHDSSPCPRCYQSDKYFYSYNGVPDQLSEITGLSITSWQGRYRGAEFSIFPGMKELELSE